MLMVTSVQASAVGKGGDEVGGHRFAERQRKELRRKQLLIQPDFGTCTLVTWVETGLSWAEEIRGEYFCCPFRDMGNRTFGRHGLHFSARRERRGGCHGRRGL